MKKILWCCVYESSKGVVYYELQTLSHTRKDSKTKFAPKTGTYSDWKYWAKFGYKCVKVEVVINVL